MSLEKVSLDDGDAPGCETLACSQLHTKTEEREHKGTKNSGDVMHEHHTDATGGRGGVQFLEWLQLTY